MIRTIGFIVCVGLMTVAAQAAFACSATDSLNVARDARSNNNDVYRNARDVATELIDTEKWTKDESVIDAGTGAGIMSTNWFSDSATSARWNDRSEWNAVLDTYYKVGHGMDTSGVFHSSGASMGGTRAGGGATMREHIRFHVWELDDALRSHFSGTSNVANSSGEEALRGWISYGGTPTVAPSGPVPIPYAGEGNLSVPRPIAGTTTTSAPASAPLAPSEVEGAPTPVASQPAPSNVEGPAPTPVVVPAPTPVAAPAPKPVELIYHAG